MDDLYSRLEVQVKALLQQCERLKHENHQLKASTSHLHREKDILLAKHKHAVTQIETMISRLKSIEEPL